MLIGTSEFDQIRDLVEARSGIVLEPGKEYLVESRLQPLLARHGLQDLAALTRRVAVDRALEREVVTAFTTNETSFFRDLTPFTFLRTVALPALEARVARGGPPAVVWSAASSTGQEAYSVAMIARDEFPELARSLSIVGTDLNAEIVERARSGRFSQIEVNRGVPAAALVRHFGRAGASWEISPEIRRMVDFRVHNLLDPFRPPAPVDIVLCRNVLIYFSIPTRHRLLERISAIMRPDGWLLVGGSEAGSVPASAFRAEVRGGIDVFRPTERAR